MRLSKEDCDSIDEQKDESNSIRTQRLLLYNYISERDDLKVLDIIEYVDDGYSGKNFERPEIKRLLDDVRKNKIQCIMVKDFSRFGRDYVEVGNYIEKVFPFLGIRFIAINNHFDSITMRAGEVPDMDFSFQNLIYDYYSVENSIKTKQVQQRRRQEGKYMSVYAPYGYMKDPQDRSHLIIDEEAAMYVRNIFEWYLQGKTKADIARLLEAKRVLTPAKYMTAKGSNYSWRYKESQGKWNGAIIGRILKNRIYTGTLISGKTESIEIGGKRVRYKREEEWCVINNTHKPIISKEVFEEVQNCKKLMLSNKDKRQGVVWDSVLKGYLRCGGCKHKLTKRNRENVSYYCRYYYALHDEKCVKGNIYEEKVKEIIFDTISKQILLVGNKNYLSQVKDHLDQERERVWKGNRYSIEKEIKKIEKENFHRYESFRTGEIEKESYLRGKNNNEKKLKQLESKYLEYDQRAVDASNIHNQAILEKILLENLIENIELYPGNRIVIRVKYEEIWSLTRNKRD